MADKKKTLAVEVAFETNGAQFANQVTSQLSKAAIGAKNDIRDSMGSAMEAGALHAFTSGKTGSAIQSFVKANLTEPYDKAIKAFNKENLESGRQWTKVFNKTAKGFKKDLAEMTAAQQRVMGRKPQTVAGKADAVGKAMQVRSAGGLLSLLRGKAEAHRDTGLSQRLTQGTKAQEAEGAGKDASKFAGLAKAGKAMAQFGKALVVISAVVGVVLVLVKAFIELDSVMKDMNKALIQGASTADFALTGAEASAGGFRKELEKMRNETTGLNRNWEMFAAKTKEQQAVLAGLNQAGYTYGRLKKDIVDTSNAMNDYSDAAGLVLTYSRAVGVESGQVAKQMGELAWRSGLSLQQVGEQFSIITREAERAGFQTARFYSAVVSATTGMAYYGVRIGEVAETFATLGVLIGQVHGEELGKSLAQEFGGSFQDNLKTVLIKGEGMSAMFKDEFEHGLFNMEQETGLDIRKMMEEAKGDLGVFRESLYAAGLGDKKESLVQLFKEGEASKGNQTYAADAMGGTSPAMKAILGMTGGKVLGEGENLGELFDEALRKGNSGEAAAFDDLVVGTGKTQRQLLDAAANAAAMMRDLKARAVAGSGVGEAGTRMGISFQDAGTKKAKVLDKSGKEMGPWKDLFRVQTETQEQQQEAMKSEQELAKMLYDETKSIKDSIDQAILGILTDIYQGLMTLVRFFTWGKSDAEEESDRRGKGVSDAQDKRDKARQDADQARRDAERAGKAAGRAETPEEERVQLLRQKVEQERGQRLAEDADRQGKAGKAMGRTVSQKTIGEKGMFMAMQGALGEDTKLGTGSAQRIQDVLTTTSEKMGGYMGPDRVGGALNEQVEALKAAGEYQDLVTAVGGEERFQDILDGIRKSGFEGFTTATDIRNEVGSRFGKSMGSYAQGGSSTGPSGLTAGEQLEGNLAGMAASDSAPHRAIGSGGLSLLDTLQKMLAESEKTATAVTTGIPVSIGDAKGVQDLIIPAGGGRPMITDSQDTLMAFKPGGAVAQALGGGGGGGGGPVNVNIYGGDQKKVYDTVYRILKALKYV